MATTAEIETLVRSCIPLVHKIARKYWGNGIEHEDLISVGNIGLVKAAHRFDPGRGFQFTTYSSYWIKAAMFMLIECAGGRRLNQEERKLFYRSKRARQVLGIDATDEEVAAFLGVDEEHVASLRARKTLSLDVPLPGDFSGGTYVDIKIDDAPTAEDLYKNMQESRRADSALAAALTRLNEREQYVIRERYLGAEKKTLKEIGEPLGLSRERVRQIEERAFTRLRAMLAELQEA